ncbi:hypothetical protein [Kitasatospora griseola]|uniref:hypothetical protein n=1 Tax=Kitasatospora griseola TaxID=2064 RepID=UPI00167109E0|nr:hypothetical protein [Kitasatospora griseola]GGR00830.1 hypothetical protein GCM10010195_65830 [Kitasatospora griseola]
MMHTIFVAAPEGTTWPLRGRQVEQRLETRFPGVQVWHKYAPVSRSAYIDFEIDVDGEPRHGSYFDHRHLILRDAEPEAWAGTIAWFLGLLPPGAHAVAMVESNPDEIRPIPAAVTVQQIADLLDGLANDH